MIKEKRFSFCSRRIFTLVNLKSAIRNSQCAILLGAMLFALCSIAKAQQPAKVPKIGFLGARSAASGTGLARLRQELSALGYVEGKNIVFESRYADNQLDRLPALADELVRIKVDVLVAADTPEALAAKNATKTIPTVFVIGGNPVTAGLVDSLARPGGNITGFTLIATVLAGKRLELLKEVVPKLSRVVVLWDPQDRGSMQQWKESQLAAKELGLELHSIEVSSANDLESAFKEATKAGNTALAVTQSPLSGQKRIADLATKNRLPAMYDQRNFVDSGGLMSYGVDRTEPYRRVASMVDKILKGAKPADLPIEQPTKFELAINLKTAKQIGLTIPPNVLARADKVIR
jgi:putative ABC transport system substrate-binding protein